MSTVREIAEKACEQLNVQDTASLNRAVRFVKDRWITVWNAHLWKDSIGYVVATAEIEGEGEGKRCIIRVPLERIRNIRYGDRAIYPVDPSNVFQLDTKAFDNFGEVCSFSELGKDEKGRRLAQIYRIPEGDKAEVFLVMGKKKCPPIGEDDEPFLTGVADVLWEYATGDMWKRDQQFQKANWCYQNGGTLLEQMRKIDGEQSAAMPRVIPEGCYLNIFED